MDLIHIVRLLPEEQRVLRVAAFRLVELAGVGEVQILFHLFDDLEDLDALIEAALLTFVLFLQLALQFEALLLVGHQVALDLHEVIGFGLMVV